MTGGSRLAGMLRSLLIPTLAVLTALALGALVILSAGESLADGLDKMVRGYFGLLDGALLKPHALTNTLVAATPLILTGLAVAIPFKVGLFNIGGEGQLIFGAIVAAGVGIWMSGSTPPIIAIIAVVAAGAVGGAFWASLSAVPKVYLGTNEIITTLMLNFIALNLMNYLVLGSFSPWRDPESTQFPQGRPIIDSGRIPEFFHRLDWGLFIAIAVAILAWFVISKTRSGFEYRVVGDSFNTARYAGIKVPKKVLGTFLASGAAAGLAGSILVAGILGKMDPRSLDLGLGFTGIIVAALARLNPIAIIPVAVLMGALNNAGPALQSIGVPSATVKILQGAILIFAVAGEFLITNRIRRPERSVEATTVEAEVSPA